MKDEMTLRVVARIKNDFSTKFGIPRQSGLADAVVSRIVFEPEYRNPDALRGIEGFSHLWLIWGFSEARRDNWSPTVRPPRLGGNKRMGVFATRSPFRPNALGLSSVNLLGIEQTNDAGTVILVSGADMMDGTPIYDIKPYLPYTDCHEDAKEGYTGALPSKLVEVDFPEALLMKVHEEKRAALMQVLEHDPRPSYQDDPEREYGMEFGEYDVHFKVADGVLCVTDVKNV